MGYTMSLKLGQFFTLPSGVKFPVVGLGTHNVTGGVGSVRDAVKYAIDIGYRSVDCAYAYENEKEVGEGIQAKLDDGTIKDKKEIFITSKIWDTHHNPKLVKEGCRKILDNLQVDKIQLLLVHWPISLKDNAEEIVPKDKEGNVLFANHDILDTWKGMEECVDAGMADSIGLSNFNKDQIERILQNSRIKPCNLQVEIHPYFSNKKLVDYCKTNNITVTAYAPLANKDSPLRTGKEPSIFDEPILQELSKEKGKSIAQIVLRFLLQRGIIVIPKSITPTRIKENFDVFSFDLTDDEMSKIWSLDKNLRIWVEKWASIHKDYPFHTEY